MDYAPTESVLVRRAHEGSGDAIEELFRRHWPRVWKLAYLITRRRDLADDVAQDAMIRAFGSLDSFDTTRPFAPWLAAIAMNAVRDQTRRQARADAVSLRVAQYAAAADASQSRSPRAHDPLFQMVMKLDASKREIVALHYWLDFSVTEISQILELPPGTVASRISRSLDHLRRQMEASHAF